MRRLVHLVLLAAVFSSLVALAGCAGSSQPGPSPSSTRSQASLPSPPLSDLQALAHAQKATKAWYTLVPLSKAFKIMQGSWGGSNVPARTTPTWVVIMRGDFGFSGGARDTWAVSVLDPPGSHLFTNSIPVDTFGAKLTPLPL